MATTAAGVKMNIGQQVQQAIEEFADDTYERFTDDKGLRFSSNDELNRELVGWCDIKTKPPSELFDHGVKVHGGDEYLMWETRLIYDNPLHNEYEWATANSNLTVLQALVSTGVDVRRKLSAALPFDLERAKAGDVVEELSLIGWSKCNKDFKRSWVRKNLVAFDDGCYSAISISNLRMKYPKKAAK
jgi:hypothetical protein